MASTRLPGKILHMLAGITVLETVLARCARVRGADVVVCATVDAPSEDPVAELAAKAGALIFRGSERDVLARYRGAAEMVGADVVLRVTSDCPLIDPVLCDRVLAMRGSEGADYACNNMPPSWPHGLDCEAMTFAALAAADDAALDPSDREHVTPWIRRNEAMKRVNLPRVGVNAADLRWTLDYPEDYNFFSTLAARFGNLDEAAPDTEALIDLMDREPALRALNDMHGRTGTA